MITASEGLEILMSNKVDKFDQLKEQAKNSIPEGTPSENIQETLFASLIGKLREYVTEKRLESNFGKKNADDMDIGGVEEKEEEGEEHQHEHHDALGTMPAPTGLGRGYSNLFSDVGP